MIVNNSTLGNETLASTTPSIPFHIIIALYSILLVWSLIANVLVIAVVYCNQNLRTNMNYLIVNMAVSDLLVPLVAMPWLISLRTHYKWLAMDGRFGNAVCKLVPFLSHISPFVSSINLVAIAFQRFIAVVYPIRRPILSRKTKWIAISSPWIVAMALFSPYVYTNRLKNKYGYKMCDFSWSPAFDYWTAQMIFFSILTVVGFALPFITIIILYTIMLRKLRESFNSVRNLVKKQAILSRQRKNRRIFRMIITIIVLFTICWCPNCVFQYLELTLPRSVWSMYDALLIKISFAFWYLWYSLAAINPCIYFVFLKDFRRGLKILCCGKTASAIEPISGRTRTTVEQSNQDPTCTPPHINTTSV